MRILWLLKTFGRGGAERLILELLPYLEGCDVVPVATHVDRSSYVPEFRNAGLEPRSLGARSDFDPRWLPKLRSVARELRPDIVHVHAPVPAVGARIALRRSQPLVYTEHNLWEAYRGLTRLANALTYRRNDRTIAVSEAVRSSVVSRRWAVPSSAGLPSSSGTGSTSMPWCRKAVEPPPRRSRLARSAR